MKGNIVRKILVALIIIAPVISYTGCKKQPKCGCGKDVLITLTNSQANVYYNATGTSIYFQTLGDPYSTYYFCNPSEMFSKLTDAKSGDLLLVSGSVYWDCNYVYQSSNSSYQNIYKVYDVQVTDLTLNLYGKK
ncbi:MAG: hypothetical protein ABSF81_12315 [Bacteroidales bacterium]|jgi:hypothetical protein